MVNYFTHTIEWDEPLIISGTYEIINPRNTIVLHIMLRYKQQDHLYKSRIRKIPHNFDPNELYENIDPQLTSTINRFTKMGQKTFDIHFRTLLLKSL